MLFGLLLREQVDKDRNHCKHENDNKDDGRPDDFAPSIACIISHQFQDHKSRIRLTSFPLSCFIFNNDIKPLWWILLKMIPSLVENGGPVARAFRGILKGDTTSVNVPQFRKSSLDILDCFLKYKPCQAIQSLDSNGERTAFVLPSTPTAFFISPFRG